jgi:hypothetical protein
MMESLTWSIGIMEYWNNAFRRGKRTTDFSFLIRTIPLFQHSIWIALIDRDKKSYDFNIV